VNLDPEDVFQALSAMTQAADNYLNFIGRSWADPRYWTISRMKLWLALKSLPPAEGGRTRIAPPDKETEENLRRLLANGSYEDVLAMCEDMYETWLFWLDLQHFEATALMGLGHTSAAATLKRLCQSLVAALPGIADLCFDDGSPFASGETKAWLEDSGGGGISLPDRNTIDWRSLSDGDPQAALARLGLPENTPRNGRDRVEKALCEARLWQRLERPRTAAAAAEELEGLLSRHALAEFDPELASRAAGTIYEVYRSLGPAFKDKARESLNMLARLNPAQVLGMAPPEDE
jgi:type VI secretion system protein VasJ